MKYLITLCLIIAGITGCKKSDAPKTPPLVTPTMDSSSELQKKSAMQGTLEHLDRSKMKTPEEALRVILNFPQGGPLPPDLHNAKDIEFLSKTDSTATYSVRSATTNMKAKIFMKKITVGGETSWDFERFEPIM
jgi:hypothetical protein